MPELDEASGLRKGQSVTVLTGAIGDDHEGIEHTMPPGSAGRIVSIDRLPGQGVSFTVFIPSGDAGDRGIMNVFDEADGPISRFLAPGDTHPTAGPAR